MMYQAGFNLTHPVTNEQVAVFQGYSDTGEEVWLTTNGIELCKFEGFTADGWTKWSQSVEEFIGVGI
jgi:hypothetical protein